MERELFLTEKEDEVMFGFVKWGEKGAKGLVAEETALCGMWVFQTTIGRESRFLCHRAAKAMQRRGIRQAVFPVGFPYIESFLKRGIRPVDTVGLHRQLAAEAVRCAMEELDLAAGSAVVAVVGDRLTGDLQRTVTELCLRNRYVLLAVPYGTEAMCRQLQREYGVSLLQRPTMDQVERADIVLLFDPREGLTLRNRCVLPLYEEGREHWTLGLPEQMRLPEGCDVEQIAAALVQGGVLRANQIEIKSLRSNT